MWSIQHAHEAHKDAASHETHPAISKTKKNRGWMAKLRLKTKKSKGKGHDKTGPHQTLREFEKKYNVKRAYTTDVEEVRMKVSQIYLLLLTNGVGLVCWNAFRRWRRIR